MMKVQSFYNVFLSSRGVSIDSRRIEAGEIFFAICGERFDGHAFVKDVRSRGALCAVIENSRFAINGFTVEVDNVLRFMQDLALFHRRQMDVPVLAVTGSNGKTTTKELLAAALSSKFRLHATRGNFNNHFGVPLTLLAADPSSEFLIIEMGANHIGEIDALCRLVEPDHGLITNIGQAHIEGFGSMEGIIEGKTELYRYLEERNGLIFYNPEDKILRKRLPDGTTNIPYTNELDAVLSDGLKLVLKYRPTGKIYNTNMYGQYNFTNIKAALTVALHFGVAADPALEAIADYIPGMNRSQIVDKDDTTYVLDAYNANPSSVELALQNLEKIEDNRPRSVILGDMNELGPEESFYHRKILEKIGNMDLQTAVFVGEKFSTADTERNYRHFKDTESLKAHWKDIYPAIKGSICLIKGSRSVALEKIID